MQINNFYKLNFNAKSFSGFNQISGPCPCISEPEWPRDENGNLLKHLISFQTKDLNLSFKKNIDSIVSIFYSDEYYNDGGFKLIETDKSEVSTVNTILPSQLVEEKEWDLLNNGLQFVLEKDSAYSIDQIKQGLENSDNVELIADSGLNISIGGFPLFFQGDETPVLSNKNRADFLMQFDLTHHEIFELMFGGDFAVFLFNDAKGQVFSVGQS